MKINALFPDIINEDTKCEFKATLNPENPVKWAKTIVAYSNGEGGYIFVGVSNSREAFGIDLDQIDKIKNLVYLVNDRHIFPHAKIRFMMRNVDEEAERFVLALKILPSDSVVRYREGDFNETVYIKGDGNAFAARPEDIISLSKRKYGVDNSVTETEYDKSLWSNYLQLCKQFRNDSSIPSIKELQNEEIVSKDGYVKSGFLMFKDDYNQDDSLICCRLWKGLDKAGTVLDSDKFKGSLSECFLSALTFIERNTKSGWEKTTNGGRKEIRAYPKEAIREALVNAIAHRDCSIPGTQIDVDIYDNRIDIVSPGSWLLPQPYEKYPIGSIPSIRRNSIISACLDVANLMERGGTGFQTMVNCYRDADNDKQPVVMAYPGFLDLRLYDLLYVDSQIYTYESYAFHVKEEGSDQERILQLLHSGPKNIKQLQASTTYKSRSRFLSEVINPLINNNKITRIGNIKSPKSYFVLTKALK